MLRECATLRPHEVDSLAHRRFRLRFFAAAAFALAASAAFDFFPAAAAAAAASFAAAPAVSAAPLLTAFAPPLAVSGISLHSPSFVPGAAESYAICRKSKRKSFALLQVWHTARRQH